MSSLQYAFLFALGVAAAGQRRQDDQYAKCMEIPLEETSAFYSCIFADPYTTAYDPIASFINSLNSELLNSYSVTLSSMPSYEEFSSTYDPNNPAPTDGPHVSDIVSSYSEFSKTHSFGDSSAGGFTFDTTAWSSSRAAAASSTPPSPPSSTRSASTSSSVDQSSITNLPSTRTLVTSPRTTSTSAPTSTTSTNNAAAAAPSAGLFASIVSLVFMLIGLDWA